MKQTNTLVKLKAIDSKKEKVQSFTIKVANKLLKLPNSAWKLEDKGFKWNGTEIAKA